VSSVSDQLRDLVRAIPLSCFRISQESGVAESTLSRFLRGRGMSLQNLDRLGEFLRIRIKAAGPRTCGTCPLAARAEWKARSEPFEEILPHYPKRDGSVVRDAGQLNCTTAPSRE